MQLTIDFDRIIGRRDPMIWGHFIEHFHRQIYGGVYDPGNPLSDAEGFRSDVIEALKAIKVPILRWPGGCFVSSYHWKDGVGANRTPIFDKAWRVEESNAFGTDEFIALCRKIGCEPYICTNAGTGTPEEMSDWVEYCNLRDQGQWARYRAANGNPEPFKVRYWSIGNENYGRWEIGAKSASEWARFVEESAKMMVRVDPTIELSAAALDDLDWNIALLRKSGDRLRWISLHQYWDMIQEDNDYADYEAVMAYTNEIETQVHRVRGLLQAMGLDQRIRIAFDEWNLRGWYHPNIHTIEQATEAEHYLTPRDLNDENSRYTMADAVFSACFLNMCLRNCDIVGMANYAPLVNTRGCVYTHRDGIVLRPTYHVFDLFVHRLHEIVLDPLVQNTPTLEVTHKRGERVITDAVDVVATTDGGGVLALALINKDPHTAHTITLSFRGKEPALEYRRATLTGPSTEAYNDIDRTQATIVESSGSGWSIELPPHSVSAIVYG